MMMMPATLRAAALRCRTGVRFASTKAYERTPWVPAKDVAFAAVPGKNGFLPCVSPARELPAKFAKVNELLTRMQTHQKDGTQGLLDLGLLGEAVEKELPLIDVTEEDMADPHLLAALFRDYGLLAAAYSLEPTHVQYQATGKYGEARDVLPASLSEPLHKVSAKLGTFPWLDYNYGLVVYNAVCGAGKDGLHWDDWRCVRMFTGIPSEEAFITVHHSIVASSGEMLTHQEAALAGVARGDKAAVAAALNAHADIVQRVVAALQRMWRASNPKDFLTFRTFQFGQEGNPEIYPRGKITYEMADGTTREGVYRGETGAMDSVVPAVDSFLALEYPRNKLTEYLFDLRRYRPQDHQRYLNWVRGESEGLGLKAFAMEDAACAVAMMRNVEYLRQMRRGHWKLVKAYILKNLGEYAHPVGTGGAPITTWLPNNLGATLEYQQDLVDAVDALVARGEGPAGEDKETFDDLSAKLLMNINQVREEVEHLQPSFTQDQMMVEFQQRDRKAEKAAHA